MRITSIAAIYALSSTVNALVPFILLPILTRYLSPSEYGEIAMFTILVAGLSAISGLSVHGAVMRKYYDNPASREMARYVGSSFQILLISSFFILFFAYFLLDVVSELFSLSPMYIFSAVLLSGLTFVIRINLIKWQVTTKPWLYAAFELLQGAFLMCTVVYLVVVKGFGADGRIIGGLIVSLVFSVVSLFILIRSRFVSFFHIDISQLKDLLKFGVPLVPHVFGIYIIKSFDRVIINNELGVDAAGVYMVALQVSMGLVIVFESFNKAFSPWLYSKLSNINSDVKCYLVRFTYVSFAVMIFIAIISFVFGPWFVLIVAGDGYENAASIIGVLALGQVFFGMYLMVTNYIFYAKKTVLLSFSTFATGILNISLLFFLVPYMGISGAALAFCISMFSRFILTWLIAYYVYPMPWLKCFVRRKFSL
jgi:O-antigen/teichoic acid export membrane protein